jgi:hypothetical protein
MKSRYPWLLMGLLLAPCVLPGARVAAAVTDRPPATADRPPASALAWKDLQPDQQQLLQPYAKDWEALPAPRQQALARGARRWLSMDPTQRAEARQRFQNWQKLPEERRQLIRKRWERFQQLDPQSKSLVRENYETFMRLPPGQRRMLRERWLAATPEERKRMVERMRERREHQHRPPPT